MKNTMLYLTYEEIDCLYHLISIAYSSANFQPNETTDTVFKKVTNNLIQMLNDADIKQGDVVSLNTDSAYLDRQLLEKKGVVTYIRILRKNVLCTVLFENGQTLEVNAAYLNLEKDVPVEGIIKAAASCL